MGVRITRLRETDAHPLDELVDGVRLRSETAFRSVYLAMADELASFAFGMISDRRTAEDIVQQAFVELVQAAPRLRGDGRALRAWLYRSVRFGCLDEYRRRARHPEIPVELVPDASSDQDYLANHLEPALERALQSLSRRHRAAVLLRHVSGLSGDEIAQVLGTTRRAAYALLRRAEANLRAALGEEAP